MNNKTIVLILLLLLMLTASVPIAFAHHEPFPPGYTYDSLVLDVTGLPESFDPAFHYDTTSASVIMNVYETLIFFDVDYQKTPSIALQKGYYDAGLVDKFVPRLATEVPTVDNGGIIWYDPANPPINPKGGLPIYTQYIFEVRQNVPFHCGGTLTARDVEYSIERSMVQDRAGGPTWLFWEPLMGLYAHEEPGADPNFGLKIDGTVEQNGTHVWFNLGTVYPQLGWLQIISQTWGGSMSEAWAVAEGDFNLAAVPGGWANWAYIHDVSGWVDPEHSFIEDAIDNPDPLLRDGGTGPYKMSYKTTSAWSIKKYDGYWQDWPAYMARYTPDRLPGYITTITWNRFVTWSTRLSRFLGGVSDFTAVPRLYRDQLLGMSSEGPGGEKIRSMYPFTTLSCFGFFFTFDVAPTTAHAGTNPGSFNPNGIPYDIFSDINVRKAFSHAIDFNKWIQDAYLGEGEQPADPIIPGLAYDDPTNPKPDFSMVKTEYYLKLAWGGKDNAPAGPPWGPEDVPGALWNGGMGFELVWPAGAVVYQLACQQLEANINGLQSDKFKISDRDFDWGTYILPHMVDHELPIFFIGWLADYADPHNFAFPFMHSYGTFSYSQVFSDPFVDMLIEQAIATPDEPWEYGIPGDGKNMNYLGYDDNHDGIIDRPAATTPFNKYEPWCSAWDEDPYGVYYDGYEYDWHMHRGKPGWTPPLEVCDWVQLDRPGLPEGQDARGFHVQHIEGDPVIKFTYTRRMLYYELQKEFTELVPSVMLVQAVARGFQQAWMRGWYDNELYPGAYMQHYFKARTHYGDCNWDGAVGGLDWGIISTHWTGPPAGVSGFHMRADLTGGTAGITGSDWGPVKGVPDGRVMMDDLAVVSAYWDVPKGPAHLLFDPDP